MSGAPAAAPAWDEARGAFLDAAEAFVELVARVGDRWAEPGLGEWDVRSLVGHTSRSFLTVETYLARPAAAAELADAAAYFRAARAIVAGPDVAERGREAGRALGDDPVAAVRQIADRVVALVGSCDGSETVTTVVGGMRLRDYLPTRTFELVVHGTDLAAALDEPFEPPAAAAREALAVVAELAVTDGRSGPLLRAATGRPLLPGYSVL